MRHRPGIGLILLPLVLFTVVTDINGQRRRKPSRYQTAPFTYVIDSTIKTRSITPVVRGEVTPRIATVVEPNGLRQDFIVDEVVLKPRNNMELREFLTTYNGRVMDDGTIPLPPRGLTPRASYGLPPGKTGLVVVKVDLSRAPLNQLVTNARRLRASGQFRYSSEAAARLSAIVADERVRGRAVAMDLLFKTESVRRPCVAKSSFEHPLTPAAPQVGLANFGFLNAFDSSQFTWLNDADIRVTDAWGLVDLYGDANKRVFLCVLDAGFSPNADSRSTTFQYNFMNNTYNAVGPNTIDCTGGPCQWHGQQVFSVAGGLINNRFGNAGTGGQVVEPVLFATGLRRSKSARAVRTAIYWSEQGARAGVINMSFASNCGFWCSMEGLDDALEEAANKGIIPIAAAGNDDEGVEDNDVVPCKESGVICVGAIGPDKRRASFSNYGSRVDIWAPGEVVKATFTPNTGSAPGTPVPNTAGTSVASPFVAGIVALMKAINPALTRNEIRNTLRAQATPSTDVRVTPGYVNAIKTISRSVTNAPVLSASQFFGTWVKWHDYFGYRDEFVSVGDFNGDCRDDVVAFTKGSAGEVFVALSTGSEFLGTAQRWGLGICVKNQVCAVGDFTGDGRDDIAAIDQESGKVFVAPSVGTSFGPQAEWLSNFSHRRGQTVLVGNFGFTPADDLAVFVHGNNPNTLAPGEARGEVFVALSEGTNFTARTRWHHFFAPGPEQVAAGDFNADGLSDIVAFLQNCCPDPAKGDVFLALSGAIAFGPSAKKHESFSLGTEVPAVGDFNGDLRYDVLSFVRHSPTNPAGSVWVALTDKNLRLGPVTAWHRNFCVGSETCLTGDFNGDRRSDIIAFTLGDAGDVFVALSSQ